jgi:hypothetical protein
MHCVSGESYRIKMVSTSSGDDVEDVGFDTSSIVD